MNASISRRNMRYRGPIESDKLNNHYAQTRHSVQDLLKGMDALRASMKSFYEERLGEITTEASGFEDIKERVQHVRGEMLHV